MLCDRLSGWLSGFCFAERSSSLCHNMDQMSFSFRFSPHNRDYTTRNILTLEERMNVIREYERHPVYQHIAEKFNCSAKQIKNIIANRQELLECHAKCHTDNTKSEAQRRRQQKIDFLGKVIYEFVLRALYHQVPLDAHVVQAKALEVKECIAIENFYPNDLWIQNFKQTYQISSFDAATLRPRITPMEQRRASLKSIDIIHYVSQREKECQRTEQQQQQHQSLDENGNTEKHMQNQYNNENNDKELQEPVVVYEVIGDDDDDDDDMKATPNETTHSKSSQAVRIMDLEIEHDETNNSVSPQMKNTAAPLPPLPDIDTYQEALRHLKVLEDFAMIKDNYRAIGLITQLTQVFQHPPKSEDFEP